MLKIEWLLVCTPFAYSLKKLFSWKKIETLVSEYLDGCACDKGLEISIWNLVHQWNSRNPLIVTIFMRINTRFVKTNIMYRARTFDIIFVQNRLKRSNFLRFWICWKFSQNCLTQANFELSSWNFVRECNNAKWCLILNFVNIGQGL